MQLVGFVLFLLALGVPGCSGDVGITGQQLGADGICRGSLAEYCEQVECPTWDEQLAKVECPGNWEIGICGELRYVWHQYFGAADYYVNYFDSSGTLVTHYGHSDANGFCDYRTWDIYYGPVPSCELVPTELSREECWSS
jgi:hypothetical protein